MKCEEVILLNAKTCLQQSELYPAQLLHKQFVELYLEQNDYLSGNFFRFRNSTTFIFVFVSPTEQVQVDGVYGIYLCDFFSVF